MERNTASNPCELRKFVIPEIITGENAALLIGRYIGHFGAKKPMIVTDHWIASLDWFLEIEREIADHVNSYVIFKEVTPNPKDTEVMAGASLFQEQRCDLIIAVGGGSPMDCAKGISIVSSNGGNIGDYEGVDEIELPGPPLICIPTTAGSSADVSQFAIILDTTEHVKKAIISKKVVPDLALIDPIPLMAMDLELTACTGMDALTHAIEAYVSNAQSALTDIHALEAVRIITENIGASVTAERTVATMCRMMFGSIEAGMAFSNASLGAVHAMAHSLGGLYGLPHGLCNSVLLGHVIEYNFDSVPYRYRRIAEQMGITVRGVSDQVVKETLLLFIREMIEGVGISPFIRIEKGDADDLEMLAESALSDPCMITNPRVLEKKEVKEIYERIIRFKE